MDWKLAGKMLAVGALGLIPVTVGLAVYGSRKDKKGKGANLSSGFLAALAGGATAIPIAFASRWLMSDVTPFSTAGLAIGPKSPFGALPGMGVGGQVRRLPVPGWKLPYTGPVVAGWQTAQRQGYR